jgi:hypothetical protein
MVGGCAGVKTDTQPLLREEADAVLAELAARSPVPRAMRATGEARLTFSGRTLKTTFAAAYDRPGWLRADLRPSYGSLGASMTAQALVNDGCAKVYFPSKLAMITGCLSDVAQGASSLDPAALILGIPDVSILRRLDNVAVRRGRDLLFLGGTIGDAAVTIEIDERLAAVTSVEIRGTGADDVMTISYGDHGWKKDLMIPRTISLEAFEGTTNEIGVEIRYETARPKASVDRAANDLSVPPGVLEVDWRELNVWR